MASHISYIHTKVFRSLIVSSKTTQKASFTFTRSLLNEKNIEGEESANTSNQVVHIADPKDNTDVLQKNNINMDSTFPEEFAPFFPEKVGKTYSRENIRSRAKSQQKLLFNYMTEQNPTPTNDASYGAESDHHMYGQLVLSAIRDVRKYLRKEKFELPTFAEKAKPFVKPSNKHLVMYQINTVHGREDMPFNKRVTLKLKVSNLNLKKAELHKFLLLVGPRYDLSTDMLTMSSDTELTSVLNKKKLSQTLEVLIKEAVNDKDYFEDIPLKTYIKRKKTVPKYPEEWLPKTQ
ncbi:hypothetical protein BB561_002082 [Smittium simulii]|uniref:Small ribosomal subunit protein mS35 mitochondrial conserved domain-containing protein n=1 Tax=Smittium simulii TaxID=133385 RepID=A0A2T9YRT8_9FUNG|nr:hypothetical protein BB561_002082 [Smittium simulii]